MAAELKRKEHQAVRTSVGIYDFTHQLVEVNGPDAGSFLDRLFVNGFSHAKVGQAKYTTMLNEQGTIIDDVIIFRMAEEQFWISTLYLDAMMRHFDENKQDERVSYRDRTGETSMIAVQGPHSRELISGLLSEPLDGLRRFRMEENHLGELPIYVARSGFTGELGYELYLPPDRVEQTMQALEEEGEKKNILVLRMTTDAILTSLPREKGYVLMSDLKGANPLEVGFDWTVDWSKDFIGKEALEAVRAQGAARALLGFRTHEVLSSIEPGTSVLLGGEEVGRVTMYTEALTFEGGIGYALVLTSKAQEGSVVMIGGQEVALESRVFYDPDDERIKA